MSASSSPISLSRTERKNALAISRRRSIRSAYPGAGMSTRVKNVPSWRCTTLDATVVMLVRTSPMWTTIPGSTNLTLRRLANAYWRTHSSAAKDAMGCWNSTRMSVGQSANTSTSPSTLVATGALNRSIISALVSAAANMAAQSVMKARTPP